MANSVAYTKEGVRMRKLSLAAPVCTIALAMVFICANPYTAGTDTPPLEASTIRIIHLWLTLPAFAAIVAYFICSKWLKWIAFYVSLPVGLYLGLAGMPSLWTWFILFVALYAFIPVRRGVSPAA